MRRLLARAAAAAAVLLAPLALTGCNGLQGTDDANFVTAGGSIVQIAADDREGPVDIAGTTLDDEPLDLADLRGRVVVLNVWASWCNPCRDEAPALRTASQEVDAAFVGLLFKDANLGAAATFEREFGIDYPSLRDEGQVQELGRYRPEQPPTTYVLDPEGRVAAVVSGAVPSAGTIEDLVDDARGGSGEGTSVGTSDG